MTVVSVCTMYFLSCSVQDFFFNLTSVSTRNIGMGKGLGSFYNIKKQNKLLLKLYGIPSLVFLRPIQKMLPNEIISAIMNTVAMYRLLLLDSTCMHNSHKLIHTRTHIFSMIFNCFSHDHIKQSQ